MRSASSRAIVLLPDPAGPSMATIKPLFLSLNSLPKALFPETLITHNEKRSIIPPFPHIANTFFSNHKRETKGSDPFVSRFSLFSTFYFLLSTALRASARRLAPARFL
jgi:hypothetical protein